MNDLNKKVDALTQMQRDNTKPVEEHYASQPKIATRKSMDLKNEDGLAVKG